MAVEPTSPAIATTRCHAPFTSLYLDQRGFARVCAAYDSQALGNVATQTLREIWHGPRARELRQRFTEGGWGKGCHVCRWQSETNTPDQAYARVFDNLVLPSGEPEWPTHLEMALGNRCNLQCIMCTGEQSSSIRRHREHFPPLPKAYPDRFFDELVELVPHLQGAKFLGGEPFLIPEHHRVFDLMIESGAGTPIHVTTNATIWNERVERVLEHLPTSMAVSMDGLRAETVERVRVGAKLVDILRNLDRFQEYTRRRGTYLGLTYCLMTENWDDFADFLGFATDRELDVYVNTVMAPSSLSLYRLSRDRLAEVLEGLEQRDAWAHAHLGRNLPVWEDQLGRLRSQVSLKEAGEPTWMRRAHEQFPETEVTIRDADAPGPDPTVDDDAVVLPAWAGTGAVATIEMDGDDRVVRADPPGDQFLDLPTDVTGRTFGELAMLLVSFYGRPAGYQTLRESPALLDRIATYETQEATTRVRLRTRRILVGDGAPGVRVTVAVRHEPRRDD